MGIRKIKEGHYMKTKIKKTPQYNKKESQSYINIIKNAYKNVAKATKPKEDGPYGMIYSRD